MGTGGVGRGLIVVSSTVMDVRFCGQRTWPAQRAPPMRSVRSGSPVPRTLGRRVDQALVVDSTDRAGLGDL
jgi:hypothetical protein